MCDNNTKKIIQQSQIYHRKLGAKEWYDRVLKVIRRSSKNDIIYWRTTTSSLVQRSGSLVLTLVAICKAFASVQGITWSSTLWTRAWTMKRVDHERYRLESLSMFTWMIDFMLLIVKAKWIFDDGVVETDLLVMGEEFVERGVDSAVVEVAMDGGW